MCCQVALEFQRERVIFGWGDYPEKRILVGILMKTIGGYLRFLRMYMVVIMLKEMVKLLEG